MKFQKENSENDGKFVANVNYRPWRNVVRNIYARIFKRN
jgi:hypothetical protein